MSWMNVILMALFTLFLASSLSSDADSAAVSSSTGGGRNPQGRMKRVFMEEADASNFFRRRSRRGEKSQDEINAEQRQILAANERKREFHEEKRNEFESYVEEDNDEFDHSLTSSLKILPEQDESSRESSEQWREFHYDGMHPPQEYNRHSV